MATCVIVGKAAGVQPNTTKLLVGRYYNGSAYAAIDNGHLVSVGGLLSGQNELHQFTTPTDNQAIGKLAIVTTPEKQYDPANVDRSTFVNAANADIRVHVLTSGDEFAMTASAFDAVPDLTANKYLTAQADTEWKRAAAITNAIAELIDIEVVDGDTYYWVRVI